MPSRNSYESPHQNLVTSVEQLNLLVHCSRRCTLPTKPSPKLCVATWRTSVDCIHAIGSPLFELKRKSQVCTRPILSKNHTQICKNMKQKNPRIIRLRLDMYFQTKPTPNQLCIAPNVHARKMSSHSCEEDESPFHARKMSQSVPFQSGME